MNPPVGERQPGPERGERDPDRRRRAARRHGARDRAEDPASHPAHEQQPAR